MLVIVQGYSQNLVTNGLTTSNNVSLCEAGDCVDLAASYFIPKDASSTYTVASVPFDPVTVNVDGGIDQDDIYSGIIDLGFTFCYFGNASNQIVIGGNGDISFDTALAGQPDPWAFTDDVPSVNLPSGGIFGAYHDLDISAGGTISYGVTGVAPFRAFVINYDVAHFSCNSLTTRQQIVLHETSNFIDVYIYDKPTCGTWNDGNAVIGIQNIGGTIGYVAPGRNTSDSPWDTTNEAWRFAPDGADLVPDFSWLDDTGAVISTNTTHQVCPNADATYTANVEYTYCDGSVVVNQSDVNVTIANGAGGDVDLGNDFSICNGSNFTLTASGSFSSPVAYEWLLDGVVVPGETSSTLTTATLGDYTVNVTFGASNCTATDTITVSQGDLVVNSPNDLTLQDDNADGVMIFDLTQNESVIAGATTGLIFTYYESLADAMGGINAIATSNAFTNTSNPDEIFVLVEDPATGCSVIESFNLFVTSAAGSCFEVLPGTGPLGEYIVDCNNPCVDMNTSFTDGGLTTTYSVSSITYNPPAAFSGLANTEVAGFESDDDTYSSLIDIPFTFSFFGNCYNQLVIGNNGMISFNPLNADGYNDWSVQPLPYVDGFNDSYQNAIYGVHQDIYISQPADGQISWETFGTAPNRYFVASFNNLYSYSCTSEGSTFQIVLYETSNEIDVFIETRCNISGTVGIENIDGTVAFTAPGRNGTTWNTTNEAWKFTPAGTSNSNYTISWFENGTVVGTGDTLNVCPTQDTTYFVQLMDNTTGDLFNDVATVQVNGVGFTLDPIAASQTQFCAGQSANLSVTSLATDLTYEWDLNGTELIGETGDSIVATGFGTYTVTATNTFGCTDMVTIDITEDLGCFLTEGISPNGDGLNDVLDAEFLNDRSGIEKIEIFSRYGVKVYEKANYVNEWFGQTDDGDELPTGTYYYVIKLRNTDPVYGNEVLKWIYINRNK